MSVAELIEVYERRRAEADRVRATAPLADVYRMVIEELRDLESGKASGRWLSAAEAAQILGVDRKTVAIWAAQGRFPGATKARATGDWSLPVAGVFAQKGAGPGPPAR